jgi:hypothetical protein
MKLPAFFRSKASAPAATEADTPPADGAPYAREERRHPTYRCNGCHAWRPATLVYMSNGGHYCPRCARAVHAWSGAKPAGRRFDDVLSIDEGVDAIPSESLTG